MSTTAQNQNIIGTLSAFVRDNSFTKVSNIKVSKDNHYPFVSFLDADGNWSHFWLSKKLAESVSEGSAPSVLKGCLVSRTTNAQGQERVKICSPSEKGESMMEVSADMF
jgi:hypothetical protein